MSAPRVAAVVVSWNRWADTRACVESLLAGAGPAPRVIVVDNGSTEPPAPLGGLGGSVELLRSPRNLGFAGGANLGIARALAGGADYVLTLNNDAVAAPDCLAALVAAAEERPRAGAVGPAIFYRDAPERLWFLGGRRSRLTLSLPRPEQGRPLAPGELRPRRFSYLCAGAMLARRALFERVGLFDPGYVMYYEDCELCMRAVAAGFELWSVPAARVYHTVAASTGGEGSPLELYYRTASVVRFLRRNARGLQRPALLGLRLALVAGQAARDRLAGRPAHASARWRGLRDGLGDRARPPE